MNRKRISIMISSTLMEDLEKIFQKEVLEATQLGVSPPPRSRVFEKLLAQGIKQFRQEEHSNALVITSGVRPGQKTEPQLITRRDN